jgi:hypothetical protein
MACVCIEIRIINSSSQPLIDGEKPDAVDFPEIKLSGRLCSSKPHDNIPLGPLDPRRGE